ncbi:hypothetical protein Z517_11844 [Fonsecaea pedrosoi CBS 271.37]|uniref:BTB domain-containing protein n=1 Tax=Fonsecaea pedrosoi CBS 271.37 TaxID=1442368 RepID=A0A0D2G2U8_9EURO|nr:uncharacterized protein Z517_11844 [Fonsecaea pedrosoi CBS 271.37]KIW75073.1 hypothetical protein Z517_11844 [Fonsecaea pedrosoi CBS 271.37]
MQETGSREGGTLDEDFEVDNIYTSPVVKVVVGSLNQEFYVHKRRMAEVSPFFKACLSAGMMEQ